MIVRRSRFVALGGSRRRDRKSTRLNSSHSQISYAVFCLKKKKNNPTLTSPAHTQTFIFPSTICPSLHYSTILSSCPIPPIPPPSTLERTRSPDAIHPESR